MVNTRRKTYDIEELQAPPSIAILERRRRWARLVREQHYQPVITEVLAEELPKYSNSTKIIPTALSSIMHECMLILSSASPIFEAAIEGNLVSRMLVDPELQEEYTVIQERAYIQPSIYVHLLTDESGLAPTPNQYLVICDTILTYLESTDQGSAWLIDNITPPAVTLPASAKGYRKYLWTSRRSPTHRKTLLRLCEGIQRRWLETPPSEHDKPFTYPPGECGYSINSHVRLDQHRARQSSNYVMNLVEDTCAYLHQTGQLPQHFRMHQFIVYLIFKPQQAAIAEIFCSGLLQVWIENGGGFNAYPAGRSVASAQRVSELEWKEHERWARENSPLLHKIGVQRERLELDVLNLEEDAVESWRDALDSEDGDGDNEMDLDYVLDEVEDNEYMCF